MGTRVEATLLIDITYRCLERALFHAFSVCYTSIPLISRCILQTSIMYRKFPCEIYNGVGRNLVITEMTFRIPNHPKIVPLVEPEHNRTAKIAIHRAV